MSRRKALMAWVGFMGRESGDVVVFGGDGSIVVVCVCVCVWMCRLVVKL